MPFFYVMTVPTNHNHMWRLVGYRSNTACATRVDGKKQEPTLYRVAADQRGDRTFEGVEEITKEIGSAEKSERVLVVTYTGEEQSLPWNERAARVMMADYTTVRMSPSQFELAHGKDHDGVHAVLRSHDTVHELHSDDTVTLRLYGAERCPYFIRAVELWRTEYADLGVSQPEVQGFEDMAKFRRFAADELGYRGRVTSPLVLLELPNGDTFDLQGYDGSNKWITCVKQTTGPPCPAVQRTRRGAE